MMFSLRNSILRSRLRTTLIAGLAVALEGAQGRVAESLWMCFASLEEWDCFLDLEKLPLCLIVALAAANLLLRLFCPYCVRARFSSRILRPLAALLFLSASCLLLALPDPPHLLTMGVLLGLVGAFLLYPWWKPRPRNFERADRFLEAALAAAQATRPQ